MKTDTAFVRTDGAIHLHTETAVDLHFPFIIHPRHTEHDHAFRFHDTLHHFLLAQIRVGHDHRRYTLNHFSNSLVKLILARVLSNEIGHEAVHISLCLLIHNCTLIKYVCYT